MVIKMIKIRGIKLGAVSGFALMAASMSGFLATDANAISLEEVVRIAISSHPDIRAAAALQRAAREQIKDAQAEFYPTLDGKAETGYEHVNSPSTRGRGTRVPENGQAEVSTWHNLGEMTVTQNLFKGFDTVNRVLAAEKRLDATRHTLMDTTESIALRAIEAFLTVHNLRQTVMLAGDNVKAHTAVVSDAKFRAEGGGGEGADVFQAGSREALESQHGQVWDSSELSGDFNVIGFAAPLVVVKRKSDGVPGSLEFQHRPRFYFNFQKDTSSNGTGN